MSKTMERLTYTSPLGSRVSNGDALEQIRQLPDCCVSTCVTSPPYFGLRNYDTPGQIGLEQTPEEYVEKLVEVFREVRRVLKDDGTLWLNIGDSYATRSGPQAPTNTRNSKGHTAKKVPNGYKYKDLIGIPWLLAFALRADGWYLRQDIIWQKPNCMPESVRDRCTKSHEYIFLLSKKSRYYFDAEAISEHIWKKFGLTMAQFRKDVKAAMGGSGNTGTTTPTATASKLTVDGKWGKATTTRLQQIFGTPVDGVVSNQWASYKTSNPGLVSGWNWEDKPNGKGSPLIKAMQKWAGMPTSAQDGEIGPATIKALQKKLGTPMDGKVSNPSQMVKALQKWANNQK